MYTIDISVNEPQVNVTSTSNNITVTSDNTLFTITNQVSNFSVSNYSPLVTFTADGGNGFDFVVKHQGEWTSGFEYTRNDVVRYEYSLYICSINPLTSYSSGTPPNADLDHWELFINNEWPRAFLTITNNLTVGTSIDVGTSISAESLDISGTGAFGNISSDELTAKSLTVTERLEIGGLRYPIQKGLYGQVLTTNGVTTATWVNLGDLVFWSLSADLFTNGHNIVSNGTSTNLTIGAGLSDDLNSYVSFTNNDIIIDTPGTINLNSDVSITGDESVWGTLRGRYTATPVQFGSGGIKFNDGSIQTVAYNGVTYTLPIATPTTLGGVKVGSNLSIDGNGVLSADAGAYTLPKASATVLGGIKVGTNLSITGDGVLNATSSEYILPTASSTVLGGVKVGDGLSIASGVLSVTSSSLTIGDVSLSTDMRTNGYKIKWNSSGGSYIDIGDSLVEISSNQTSINAYGSSIDLTGSPFYNTSEIIIESIGDISVITTGTSIINAPIQKIGQDVNHSKLYVEKIYNYEGTFAPNFPAGIQFGDQTVQRTAFEPDQGLLP